MPTIAEFYGLSIRMYYNDHEPPQVHAYHAGLEALVAIADGEVIEGELPRTALRIVKDWALLRREALRDNWRRARESRPLQRIPGPDVG